MGRLFERIRQFFTPRHEEPKKPVTTDADGDYDWEPLSVTPREVDWGPDVGNEIVVDAVDIPDGEMIEPEVESPPPKPKRQRKPRKKKATRSQS